MNDSLARTIEQANKKAGRERQRVFAKKAYLKTMAAQLSENLCLRAEELIKEVYECIATRQTAEVCKAIDALELAIKLDRRSREQK